MSLNQVHKRKRPVRILHHTTVSVLDHLVTRDGFALVLSDHCELRSSRGVSAVNGLVVTQVVAI